MILDRFLNYIRGEKGYVENYIGQVCGDNLDYDNNHIIEYTYALCVEKVGNLVARCKKETYRKDELDLGVFYYKLNVRPNRNQSAENFWKKIVEKMFYGKGEAVVINVAGNYYVADSYTREDQVFRDSIYRDVYVEDQKVRSQPYFRENEVYRFSLENFLGYTVADAGSFYDHILNTLSKQYLKKKYNKPVFEVPGINPLRPKPGEADPNLATKESIREFLHKEGDTALILDGQVKVGKYESSMGEGYTDDGPNIVNFTNEMAQMVASMFSLPLGALRGDDVSLVTCINLFLRPLLDVFETELNGKYYSRANYLAGSRVKINTAEIEKTSALERAQTNDYKLRSGIYSINEIRREEGLTQLDDEWADVHFMTLNYDIIDKFAEGTQGSGGNKNRPTSLTEADKEDEEGGDSAE